MTTDNRLPCAHCGRRDARASLYYADEDAVCDRCSCVLAGVCGACGGDVCEGKAWPDGVGYDKDGRLVYMRIH